MEVIWHQAIGVAQPVEAVGHLIKKGEETNPIAVIGEDLLSSIAACGGVIDATLDQDSGSSWHAVTLRSSRSRVMHFPHLWRTSVGLLRHALGSDPRAWPRWTR